MGRSDFYSQITLQLLKFTENYLNILTIKVVSMLMLPL